MTEKNFKDIINDSLRDEKPLEFQKAIRSKLKETLSRKVAELFKEVDSSKNPEASIVSNVEATAKNLGGTNVAYNEGALNVSVGDKQSAVQLIEYLEQNTDVDSYTVEAEMGDSGEEDSGPVDLEEISDDSTLQFEFTIYIKPNVVSYADDEAEEDLEEEVTDENMDSFTEEFVGAEKYLLEAKKIVVFRGAKKITKMSCAPGQRWDPEQKKCVKMTAQELRTRHVASLKGAKKRKAKLAQIVKKRGKSLAKRQAAGL